MKQTIQTNLEILIEAFEIHMCTISVATLHSSVAILAEYFLLGFLSLPNIRPH